jgi:hypothetical protein
MAIQDAKVRDVSFILIVVCINITQISFFVKCYMVFYIVFLVTASVITDPDHLLYMAILF